MTTTITRDAHEIAHRLCEDHCWDWANEYGEPGYGTVDTTTVVLGNYWCRCSKFGTDSHGRPELRDYAAHHPRVWQAMEDAGIEFEWHDEWLVDHETGKAYRTTADSYMWQPTAMYDDNGEVLSPDSDIEEWIAYAANETGRCLFGRYLPDLLDAGFIPWPDEDTFYENGWHPGQTDDPGRITLAIRDDYPDHDIVFVITDTGQFDVRFRAFIRGEEQT